MARKPTRFWHPARRLRRRAQEETRALMSRSDHAPNLDSVRPRLQHYLRAIYGESVTIESLAPPKKTGWATRALMKVALARQRSTSESDAACMRLPEPLPRQNTGTSPLEPYRVTVVQHAERLRRASVSHARDVRTELERDLYQLAEAATIDVQILASQPGLRTALDAARTESMAQRRKPRFRTEIELPVEEMVRQTWLDDRSQPAPINIPTNTREMARPTKPDNHDGVAHSYGPTVPRENDTESNATSARRTAVALEVQYGRNAARAYRRVPDITLWQTTVNSQLTDEQATALETKMRQSASQPPLDEWHSLSRWAIPGGAQSQSAPNKPGNTPEKSDSERASDKRNQRARMVPVMRKMPATQPRAISSHPNHIPSTLLTPAQSVTQVSPQRAVIDINGSTGDDVLGAQRVIDIERIAALVATAAFDAPGDDYSILAFSSAGPSNVRVHTLKQFGEKNSAVVLQRMIGGNR